MKMTRLIVAIFAALAMTVLMNAGFAFSQDAADSDPSAGADSGAAVSGTSVDANWESSGPAIDEDAETADKVLEIPQAACNKDGQSVPCAGTSNDGTDDDGEAINAPSAGAPQPSVDDDTTASTGATPDDWGNADDYQNQQAYAVPYAAYAYPYPITGAGTMKRTSQTPPSAFAPLSSPITQAAQPPLSQGPWMTPSSMSAFSRPAGSPMMMSAPLVGFHH